MNEQAKHPDPMTRALAIFGILLALADLVFAGGVLKGKVDNHDASISNLNAHVESEVASIYKKFDDKAEADARRDVAIARIETKLDYITETVARIDKKLESGK